MEWRKGSGEKSGDKGCELRTGSPGTLESDEGNFPALTGHPQMQIEERASRKEHARHAILIWGIINDHRGPSRVSSGLDGHSGSRTGAEIGGIGSCSAEGSGLEALTLHAYAA
jgi:hypothetical protein